MKKFVGDFETATWCDDETWVWAWALCEIDSLKVDINNSIESFFWKLRHENNPVVYMHNLKFDGEFILYYLLKQGFTYTKKNEKQDNTFSCLISDMGLFYQIEVYLKVTNKKVNKITFIDSLKIINQSVEDIAKAFNLEENKLELDYDTTRERGHILTLDEELYIKHDVIIPAKALKILFDLGHVKMTAGSNALADFKEIIGINRFRNLFKKLSYEVDRDLRKAYRGGFTYMNPIYEEITTGKGTVLDINSMYPSIMRYEMLPFGEPYFFEGEYKEDKIYPLYIQRVTCSFKIKKNKIPTIQIKKSRFVDNEYITDSGIEPVSLTLTNIDLNLFFEQYDVYDLKFICGWKFKSIKGIFNNYIDKWIDVKNEATLSGNKGLRQISKIFLNSLYGKFATSLDVQGKIPYLENDIVNYKLSEQETKDGIYLPMGIFITSYGRDKIVRTSQSITDYSLKKYGKDLYCYSDTDSIHCLLTIDELKEFCDIDKVRLGAWKHENPYENYSFRRAKFVRQKTYIEEIYNYDENDWEISITCAGLPKQCYNQVTWENFKQGLKIGGKLTFTHVRGGVILKPTEFTIKCDKKLKNTIKNF